MGAGLFDIEMRRAGRSAQVLLHGELDLAAALDLQGLLDEFDASGLDRVVVDLRGLTFIDSTGMNVISRLDRWGRGAGRTLAFVRPPPTVLKKLQNAGLARLLRFIETPDALGGLGASGETRSARSRAE